MKCRVCGQRFAWWGRVERTAPPVWYLATGALWLAVTFAVDRCDLVARTGRLYAWGWIILGASLIAWLVAREQKPTCPSCKARCRVFFWSW